MTAFIILAGGRGTRVGRVGGGLHKALLPLDGRAVLTHLFELAPPGARLIVCLGYRGDQIRDYVAAAHPTLHVTFVDDPRWQEPGSGPGTGLGAAREVVGDDDMIFTSCDTLWDVDPSLWDCTKSWVGVAPLPPGTDPLRWCRVRTDDGEVQAILDKRPGDADHVYVGLASITRADLTDFWEGVVKSPRRAGERQVSGGFDWLLAFADGMIAQLVSWTDVGDERSYRDAVARVSGYDWTKTGEATYVLPRSGRVVKYIEDAAAIACRVYRAVLLADAVPYPTKLVGDNFMTYDYVRGRTVYAALDMPDAGAVAIVDDLLAWRESRLTRTFDADDVRFTDAAATTFYRDKTRARVDQLDGYLRDVAYDAVSRVDWDALVSGVIPGRFHGDLNFGNVLLKDGYVIVDPRFVGIDWRGDFGMQYGWGDLRYDVAKLIGGCVVHWDNARRGDFRPWATGTRLRGRIVEHVIKHPATCGTLRDVNIIGALSLINSAPLHAAPLDEILVARGCAWLLESL